MPNPSSASSPYTLPEEIRNLLADVETFVADILKGENLSKKAKEKRESLIKKIKDVKSIYLQEFQDKGDAEDGDEYDDPFAGSADTISLASERYDKDDEAPSDGNQFPPIAAQDLPSVLKAGYLEKRRKDHSFLGFEWQKRWCALSKTVFYYYGSDKDKQQKGEFAIDGYNVRMNHTLRKDAKKDCCFEVSAPDKRVYQFTAASPKDAEEWVQQLKFVLQDMGSDIIPEDDDERGDLYDDVDHPLPISSAPAGGQPIDDEIYEELPEEEEDTAPVKVEEQRKMSQDIAHHTTGQET
ncbi:src kinase associated phosphoprotein 2 [Rhinolophus ferrumequinum]|uniref:Src kinase associated phosphoprotein 2 n=1 Tax=Rhinolophus ferrumequinum TaxID=59479 RepID=A0A7J7TNY0_RHIFE|nr:src kinase associated phosphoprotein 2 [Rhinolophus ferrumequinum]